MSLPATFTGKPLDVRHPDKLELTWTDAAVHLARCCRSHGAIWLDSLHHAVLGVRLATLLELSPWVAALLVARTLPDAFLGAPEACVTTLQQQLRVKWGQVLRRRLRLPEEESAVTSLLLDALERRLLVLEWTTGSHAHARAAAAAHGGPPTSTEMRAWEDSIAVRRADRCRNVTTPGLGLQYGGLPNSGAIPVSSRGQLVNAVQAVAGREWTEADDEAVYADWERLVAELPRLLRTPTGRPLPLPPEVQLRAANDAVAAAEEG